MRGSPGSVSHATWPPQYHIIFTGTLLRRSRANASAAWSSGNSVSVVPCVIITGARILPISAAGPWAAIHLRLPTDSAPRTPSRQTALSSSLALTGLTSEAVASPSTAPGTPSRPHSAASQPVFTAPPRRNAPVSDCQPMSGTIASMRGSSAAAMYWIVAP